MGGRRVSGTGSTLVERPLYGTARGPESVAALSDGSDNTPSGPPTHPTARAVRWDVK